MAKTTSTSIETIFRRPIARDINTVVKVEQEDERVVQQELEEYVLTSSLERHFSDILESVIDTEHDTTEDTGVWISGFFGSGKSHFMKILGYLLEDRPLPSGGSATDIFKRRTQDETLKAAVSSVSSKFASDVLMFQIGAKENKARTESISDIIYREFNKKLGYAETPWIAQIEKDLEREGRYEEFKQTVEEQSGSSWETRRTSGTFVRKDIKQALASVTPDFTEEDATKAIEDVKDDLVITADSVTEEILEHVERKESETGDKQRYFVFLDEISQFIGDDDRKLLELQSLAEEFGRQGNGKLWLGVTSQAKLEELVPGLLAHQEEESKVVDRFPHRYDLISENLERVIRDRILQKDEQSVPELADLYEANQGLLSAKYKLRSDRSLEAVAEDNFIDCYPFLPYQLEILPDIFAGLRGRGSDDSLTGRERTLIDVTHSVFNNDPHELRTKEVGTLVTLDVVFDEIREEINDDDQLTIENVAPQNVDTTVARQAMKALYLLQRLDWIPNTAENIATTLYRTIGDTSGLDQDIEDVLEALVSESYIGRSDEGYRFLSQTERSIEEEIASVEIRPGDIRRHSKKLLRDILDNVDSVNHEGNAFDVSVTADEETLTDDGEVSLVAYSPVYQSFESVDRRAIKTRSHDEEGTLYWIADTAAGDQLRDDIKRLMQIQQLLNEKRSENLSQDGQKAVTKKAEDLSRLENDVKAALRDAFREGVLIYYGSETELDGGRDRLETFVQDDARAAIPRVFTKLGPGLATVRDNDIERVFEDLSSQSLPSAFEELNLVVDGDPNTEAQVCREIADEIESRTREGEGTTGQDILDVFQDAPYGWSRNVVRLAMAVLFRNGDIEPTYQEKTYGSYTADGARDLFTGIRKFRKTTFSERETVDKQTRNKAKQLLNKLFDTKVKNTNQEVAAGIDEVTAEWNGTCEHLIPRLRDCSFPLVDEMSEFKTYLDTIRGKQTPAREITTFLEHENDLEPLARVAQDVEAFERDGKLDEYETYRRFLNNEWKTLVGLADGSTLVALDDTKEEAARRLRTTLDSDSVIDNWSEAETDYGTVEQAYASAYSELDRQRYEAYTDAIAEVRDYGDDLESADLDRALSDLNSRQGDDDFAIDTSAGEHLDLSPPIDQLEEHVRTVDSYKRQAKDQVDELRSDNDETDGPVKRTVSINSLFSGVIIRSEGDLDPAIGDLREQVEDILATEDEVEIRFR